MNVCTKILSIIAYLYISGNSQNLTLYVFGKYTILIISRMQMTILKKQVITPPAEGCLGKIHPVNMICCYPY